MAKSNTLRVWLALTMALLVMTGTGFPSVAAQTEAHEIFVTSNGWHTGIVLAKADLPPGLLGETADFPDAVFFEFGWGDAKFYPSKETTIGVTLQAAVMPTPAVMHMVVLSQGPARYFPQAEVVSLSLNKAQFGKLAIFIDGSFDRSSAHGGARRARQTAPGLYASAGFYPAKGKFHLFNTCNNWTARALRAAGLKIEANGTNHAEALMQQVRDLRGL